MRLPECHTREKLATFNQLKIFLYALAAEYAPLFGKVLPFIEPHGYPERTEMNFSGLAYIDRKAAGKWSLKCVSQAKFFRPGRSWKKYHVFLDYRKELPEDFACCAHGPQRLIVSGAMKFFHVEAKPLSESYLVLASGEWPHMSVGLGIYLANEYPEIKICSVAQMKDLIEGDAQSSRDESAAMMN